MRWCWSKFQCQGVLLIWVRVGQGPTTLAVGAGGGWLDIFLSSINSLFFLPPRYGLKYCLKGLLSPKQPPKIKPTRLTCLKHQIRHITARGKCSCSKGWRFGMNCITAILKHKRNKYIYKIDLTLKASDILYLNNFLAKCFKYYVDKNISQNYSLENTGCDIGALHRISDTAR